MWFWMGLVIGIFMSVLMFFFTKGKTVVASVFVVLSILMINICIGWSLGAILTFGLTPICIGFISGCTMLYAVRCIVNRFKKNAAVPQNNTEEEISSDDAQIYYLINRLKEIKEENNGNNDNT